jgi:hypothetical protein
MKINYLPMPTSWAELTLAQYIVLATPGAVALATALPSLTPELLNELNSDEQSALASYVVTMLDEQVLASLLPTPGLLEIGMSAYGLYRQAEKYLTTIPDAHPMAHGAYLYALYRNPTGTTANEQELAAAHAAVLARPVVEVYADCAFFLASYARVGTGEPAQGVAQPGLLRVQIHTTPTKQSLQARLGNLWNTGNRAQA